MSPKEKRALIQQYIDAYNAFDADAMMKGLHDAITFKNIAGEAVTARADGHDEFRALAETSAEMFAEREQVIQDIETDGDGAVVRIRFTGRLAVDLPNGMAAGDTMKMDGRSEFAFAGGKIMGIVDIS